MKSDAVSTAAALLGHRLGEQSERKIALGLAAAARLCGGNEEKTMLALKNQQPGPWRAFTSEVSINETYFFRHPEHFDLLNRLAADAYTRGAPYRTAWSIGCASGEEAWSLAMTLDRYCDEVQVAGTDVSLAALEQARSGRYRSRSFREITAENIPGLRQSDGMWEVEPRLKSKVTFRESNLARDRVAPPAGMPPAIDVVFCRNVMVYLTPEVAQRTLKGALAAVSEGGLLVLGSLEAPAHPPEGFHRVDDAIPSAFVRGHPKAREAAKPARAKADARAPARAHAKAISEARALADRGDLAAALRKAASGPPDADALMLSASIETERGNFKRAKELLRHVLALAPDHVPALFSLVLVALKLGDASEVERTSKSLKRLVDGKSDDDEVGMGGLKVAYVRQVLAGLT